MKGETKISLLLQVVNLDTRTLIGVLIWINIAAGIIVFGYQKYDGQKENSGIVRNMALIRLAYAFGYLLMFYRGVLPDLVSVNISNTLLFYCHYLDALMVFVLVGVSDKIKKVMSCIFVTGVLVFNVFEFIYADPSLRVGIASVVVFSIYLLPSILLIASKNSNTFKKHISVFYLFLLSAQIPRAVDGFRMLYGSVLTNAYAQTLMFLSLILLMITNTIVFLLYRKEERDTLLKRMATYDGLTGLLNRQSFLTEGKWVFEAHMDLQEEMAIIFFDIDLFKELNDEYGHDAGDEALIRFAEIIKHSLRPSDLSCRYGGDEFVALLKTVKQEMIAVIAERIMKETEQIILGSGVNCNLTVSAGCAAGVPKAGESLDDFIHKSDVALYNAKKNGRNKLAVYDEIQTE